SRFALAFGDRAILSGRRLKLAIRWLIALLLLALLRRLLGG
ncbi:MAG: hypothetical protein QOI53_2272, partial [Verrucomicrobiota bacterium]|nr:hypothetical protein [Verrucomicrobiota bacterium]